MCEDPGMGPGLRPECPPGQLRPQGVGREPGLASRALDPVLSPAEKAARVNTGRCLERAQALEKTLQTGEVPALHQPVPASALPAQVLECRGVKSPLVRGTPNLTQ